MGSFAPSLVMDAASGHGRVIGRASAGSMHSLLLRNNGIVQETLVLEGGIGQDADLSTAVGSDGVHVLYRTLAPPASRHFSSPDGQTWTDLGSPFPATAVAFRLGAASYSDVYASYVDAGMAHLEYWNGAAWIPQHSHPGDSDMHPGLGAFGPSDQVYWTVYDPVGNMLRFVEGSQTNPFATTMHVPTESPIREMAVSPFFSGHVWAIAGATIPSDEKLGYFGWDSPGFTAHGQASPLGGLGETTGRTIARSLGFNFSSTLIPEMLPMQVAWFAHGSLINSQRITLDMVGMIQTEEISHGPFTFIGNGRDFCRTATSSLAQGVTPVGLICDLHGFDPYFECGVYGGWERLPLPPGLGGETGARLSKPELTIGFDGRWHIVYYDPAADEIRVRSTL